jgi:ankyrin repeat protein
MVEAEMDADELQMLFEVHTGKYVTIHEFETNVDIADSTTYFDKNMATTTEFQTISQRRVAKFNNQPWEHFWSRKQMANEQLIDACKKGRSDKVAQLLNPLIQLDHLAELRYTDDNGLSAFHHAIIKGHNSMVKILLT